MGQPAAAFRTIVIGARRADFERERLVPMDAFRAVGHVEAVLDCLLYTSDAADEGRAGLGEDEGIGDEEDDDEEYQPGEGFGAFG